MSTSALRRGPCFSISETALATVVLPTPTGPVITSTWTL